MNNATSDFLGAEYFWWDTTIKLEDVQPLFGGVKLTLRGGRAFVIRIEPGGQK
jgi:hypothetical protein